jgi:hypothetical protein
MAAHPKGPREWPLRARQARDETLADLAAARAHLTQQRGRQESARQLIAEARAKHLRDPRLLAVILDDLSRLLTDTDIADVQTLIADCQRRLDATKRGEAST